MTSSPMDEIGFGDLEEGDEVSVIRIADNEGRQRALFMPTSMSKKLDRDQLRLVADMQRDVMQIQQLQEHIESLALKGREWGLSWAAIGWSVGLTAEGARKKWSEPEEL